MAMIDKLLTYPTILPFIFVFDNTKNPPAFAHAGRVARIVIR
jgi:hypothetical protein